jgi:FtsP/CotA-like multicopper oxidase with cupredoxin domain
MVLLVSQRLFSAFPRRWTSFDDGFRNVYLHLFQYTPCFTMSDGVPRLIYTINGQTPGPLLEATQGETFVVTVINKLPMSVGMHWCVFLPE